MEKAELTQKLYPSKVHRGLGIRHFQAALTFFGITMSYMLRLNMSVAVVGMITSIDYKVDLSSETKALVLSSMFWGYGLLQIPAGALGRRGYAVKLMAFGNLAGGLLSLMIPLAAMNFGYIGICVIRFSVGLVQGLIYPNVHNVMAIWVIPQEKNSVVCIVQGGNMFGSLLSMVVSGYLGYYYDWPTIFYVSGGACIIWGIIHATIGAERPESCKIISNEEQVFMKKSFQAEQKEVQEKMSKVPWKQILTSGPVLTISLTSWCSAWGVWTLITLTPTYISDVFGFNLGDNGLLSALPYLFCWINSIILSLISALIKKKTSIPDSFLRPFWSSIGLYGTSASLMILAFAPVTSTAAIVLLIISMSVTAAINLGHACNGLDLSPNFAGVIMSITNTTATLASILGPLVSTFLITDSSDMRQWRVVFILSAMIAFIGNTAFIFWGTTKKQPWDDLGQKQDKTSTPTV